MSLLTNECSICFENFKNSDTIYSTSCGHIYHLRCMEQWQRNGSNCPDCRTTSPTSHKIFLTLDDRQPPNPNKIQELMLKLKSSNESCTRYYDQLKEIELNFMQLQEQFTALEIENKNLQERVNEMNDSEKDFLNLSKQYTETTEYVKYLEDQIKELQQQNQQSEELSKNIRTLECRIQELIIQNEQITENLRLKNMEMESLKNEANLKQNTNSDIVLSERIKILEQKLACVNNLLEKEIATSSKLTIENLKLEHNVNNLKSPEKKDNRSTNIIKNNKISNQKKQNPTSDRSSAKRTDNFTSTKIFIKELPASELSFPLENIIIKLGMKMNIILQAEDIVEVKLVENTKTSKMSKIQLVAEFKSVELKTEFLAKKNNLKNHSSTNAIVIGEYMGDELYSLMNYAKEKLRNNGYDHIYCSHNMIFAKKHRSHPRSIPIRNKAHVDSLLKKKEFEESANKDQPTENCVDENYYQL